MALRRKLIAGNWKMHLGPGAGAALAREVVKTAERVRVEGVKSGGQFVQGPQVVVCPPFVTLAAVEEAVRGSQVAVGGQNLHWERQGAFTGEVSGEMLVELGCTYVIVGHSERRHVFGESDEAVARKARAALDVGLTPIVCVGETLAEREAGETSEVVERQMRAVYGGMTAAQAMGTIVAYEPVWAIGTGRNATPEQAVEVHAGLRTFVAGQFGEREASDMRILYGGSVKPDNAASLVGEAEIDGALVGGASLRGEEFGRLIEIAAEAMR